MREELSKLGGTREGAGEEREREREGIVRFKKGYLRPEFH